MPALEFNGKQHLYAHHLTVSYRPLVLDMGYSLDPATTDDNVMGQVRELLDIRPARSVAG